MCGIFGRIGDWQSSEEIEAFVNSLSHRGPDDQGIYHDEASSLLMGQTRLSIIDLTQNGHQPMFSLNKRYVIVFNGEVYNYSGLKGELEIKGYSFLTHSDTEVVLNSYIEWGEKCLDKFNGMFAFCIYDKQKKELFIARDRFGIKPLIYSFFDNQFTFCSELKPLLISEFFPKKISKEAVASFFTYGSIAQPSTILEGVYHLLPAHYMKVQEDLSHEVCQYYDFVSESLKRDVIYDYGDAIREVKEQLRQSVRYNMVSDVEVGAFLSGGVDSTSLVALMIENGATNINTFSVGFKSETCVEDETKIAERSAKKFGCKHKNVLIDGQYVSSIFFDFISSLDQPSIDGINTYIVSKEAAKNIKVAVNGLGADEIFCGYPHFGSIPANCVQKRNLLSKTANMVHNLRPNKYTSQYRLYGLTEKQALKQIRNLNISPYLNDEFQGGRSQQSKVTTKKNDLKLTSMQKVSVLEINKYMLNTLLRDSDVCSMAHSIELRPVFLDHELVELAFSLRDEFKIRGSLKKAILVDSVKDILPEDVWNRKKTGFEMPFSEWMNNELNHYVIQVLNSSKANIIFKKTYLDSLRSKAKKKILTKRHWAPFMFLAWLSVYEVEV